MTPVNSALDTIPALLQQLRGYRRVQRARTLHGQTQLLRLFSSEHVALHAFPVSYDLKPALENRHSTIRIHFQPVYFLERNDGVHAAGQFQEVLRGVLCPQIEQAYVPFIPNYRVSIAPYPRLSLPTPAPPTAANDGSGLGFGLNDKDTSRDDDKVIKLDEVAPARF